MNTFTQVIWEVLNEALDEDNELLADLTHILFKEYKPFLTTQQALEVNIHALKTYFLDKIQQWVDWLPDTPINQLGAAFAQEALSQVYWSALAALLQERLASLVS